MLNKERVPRKDRPITQRQSRIEYNFLVCRYYVPEAAISGSRQPSFCCFWLERRKMTTPIASARILTRSLNRASLYHVLGICVNECSDLPFMFSYVSVQRLHTWTCKMYQLAKVVLFASSVLAATPLIVLNTTTTPNGFHNAARGFNTFPIQANTNTTPSWTGFDQENVKRQCDVLATPAFQAAGYQYCSLDSGWSTNNGDANGRLLYDPSLFDLPEFATELHQEDLKLGVYVLPGAFCSDGNKTILGTDGITLNSTFNGNDDGFLRCDFDFTKPGVQEWHNSVVDLFAEWYDSNFVRRTSTDPSPGELTS